MKKLIFLSILALSFGTSFSQTYPSLRFRKPTTSDNVTWRFKSITSGVDAYISVVSKKNATLDKIDDSSIYANAWNPFIKFTNTPANATDSSYVEFKIEFKKISNGSAHTFTNMAMTIVDCDGGLNGLNVYREMFKSTLPATPKGIVGTLLTTVIGGGWLTNISGPNSYSSTDTNNFLAMSQINYSNITSYNLKVGVLGRVGANTTREYSLYFKNFAPLTLVLPVKLMDFKGEVKNNGNLVQWTTTSEENSNRFELYRSFDGKNFTLAGTVKAAGNSQMMSTYNFVDQKFASETQEHVYYKLRMIDNDGQYTWSHVIHINNTPETQKTTIGSVYPNPSKGQLNVTFKSIADTDFTIDVIDMFGKTLQSFQNTDIDANGSLSMDLSNLANGVYFIRVNHQDGSNSSIKCIKN